MEKGLNQSRFRPPPLSLTSRKGCFPLSSTCASDVTMKRHVTTSLTLTHDQKTIINNKNVTLFFEEI